MALQGLAEAVLSLCDLFEAEGRLLRSNVLRTTGRCLLLLGAAFFGIAALVFFLTSAYEAMLAVISRTWALCVLGALSAMISLIFLWSSKSCRKTGKGS